MEEYFASIGATIAVIVAITQFLKTYLFKTEGWYTRLLSWVISVVVVLVGWVAGYGWMGVIGQWYVAAIVGFFVGMSVNGIFDGLFLQQIINFIIALFPEGIQKVFVARKK